MAASKATTFGHSRETQERRNKGEQWRPSGGGARIEVLVGRKAIVGPLKLTLAADVFNVMNSNTETVRTRQLNSATFGTLNEILSPRILRVTAGIKF